MDPEVDRLLKTARDAIRQGEENIARFKELCDCFESQVAYALIGALPECTDEELKSAYHRKVAYWHPDRFHAADIPTEMREYANHELARINEAYTTLKTRRSGSEPS